MYQVLARKWRPKNFHELVGQQHVTQALTYALDNDRIHHAYLFTGTRGVGKTTIARIFAKSLNCQKNGVSAEPCGECTHCQEIDQGRFPDLIEVDAASRTGVDDTRELLDNVPYAPVKGRYKVYLIDEVHMFSRSSFNALLKTLEEPPAHVKFILATTDPQKMPATVLSRCLQFHLKNMTTAQIVVHLQAILEHDNIAFEQDALKLLAEAGSGSMRDSLSLLDQAIAFGRGAINSQDVGQLLGAVPAQQLRAIMHALADADAPALRSVLHTLDEFAPDHQDLLRRLLYQLQEITVAQLEAERFSGELDEEIKQLAARLPVELVQLWYQIATDGWQSLAYQPDARLAVEMILLRMIALRPVLPTANPADLRAIPDAAPADQGANPVASLDDIQAMLEDKPARGESESGNSSPPVAQQPVVPQSADDRAEQTSPESHIQSSGVAAIQSGEQPPVAQPATNPVVHEDTAGDTVQQQADNAEDDGVPPWVSEQVPDVDNHGESKADNVATQRADKGAGNDSHQADDVVPPWVSEQIAQEDDALPAAEVRAVNEDVPPPQPVASQDVEPARPAMENEPSAPVTTVDTEADEQLSGHENVQENSTLEVSSDLSDYMTNPWQWAALVKKIDLPGTAGAVAEHSVVLDWQAPELILGLDEGAMMLADEEACTALSAALSAHINAPCQIVFRADRAIDTPSALQAQSIVDERRRAEAAIYDHPVVRDLQQRLGAIIVPGSTVSLKPEYKGS